MTAIAATFVINLDRDVKRLAHMQEQARAIGLTFERVPAVYLDQVPSAIRPYLFDPAGRPHGALLPAEIGCYASHLGILKRVVAHNIDGPVLVLEDDVVLHESFHAVLAEALAHLPRNWDILRLSNPPKRSYLPLADLGQGFQLVRYSKIPNSSAGYLISPAGAAKFLKDVPRTRAVDEDLRRPWHFGLNTFGLLPLICVPNTLESSINGFASRPKRALGIGKWLRNPTESPLGGLARLQYNWTSLGLRAWADCATRNVRDRFVRPAPLETPAPARVPPARAQQ